MCCKQGFEGEEKQGIIDRNWKYLSDQGTHKHQRAEIEQMQYVDKGEVLFFREYLENQVVPGNTFYGNYKK